MCTTGYHSTYKAIKRCRFKYLEKPRPLSLFGFDSWKLKDSRSPVNRKHNIMNDMVGYFMFIKNTRKASGMVVKKNQYQTKISI